MIKCNIGNCIHEAWWMCLRCNFIICGDCHEDKDEFPKNPTEGDGRSYCSSCAEYHEEWKEIAWLKRSMK